MTPKEDLLEVRNLLIEKKSLEDSIEEAYARLTNISPVLSDMPHATGDVDKMTNGVSKVLQLKDLYRIRAIELQKKINEKYLRITMIDNSAYRTILKERYFECKDFKEIEEILNYTYGHVIKLHGYALQEYGKMIHETITD